MVSNRDEETGFSMQIMQRKVKIKEIFAKLNLKFKEITIIQFNCFNNISKIYRLNIQEKETIGKNKLLYKSYFESICFEINNIFKKPNIKNL